VINAHSHAFQLGLRGRTRAGADFWGWREPMYALAGSLDPDSIREVSSRAFGEMREAGYTAVGEFHYVHHQPDGTPYEEPNALALAVVQAAADAGLEIVLIPAAYHRAGPGRGPEPGQRRFCDATVEEFLGRVDALRAAGVPLAVAAHSVRAVPRDWLREIAAYSDAHGLPRHVHASEQPREIDECRAEHGGSPIELLHETGFLGPRTSVIHGIHVSERDVALLAETDTIVVTCPTTEGDLGDGIFPALRYRDAGVRMAIGSDSNLVIDPGLEMREMEWLARREGLTRQALEAHYGDLGAELAANGGASLGLA
jgi:formimidoylglutamate deiminase